MGEKFVFFGMKKSIKTVKRANKKTIVKRIGLYFSMRKQLWMMILVFMTGFLVGVINARIFVQERNSAIQAVEKKYYWFVLSRKSNIEYLYKGIPGDKKRSDLIKTFVVKSGIPGERPTPLPQLTGEDYWLVTKKYETKDNPETAPYFIELNVPTKETEPFGPEPYRECGEVQCNWQIPGPFGLHGVGGDLSRLSYENPGSSGCIRHKDEDIIYLYNLLNPKEEIRYYIEDV